MSTFKFVTRFEIDGEQPDVLKLIAVCPECGADKLIAHWRQERMVPSGYLTYAGEGSGSLLCNECSKNVFTKVEVLNDVPAADG